VWLPGELGIDGFSSRKDYSYDGDTIANATMLERERAWDVLARERKKVILLSECNDRSSGIAV
jgi:predicted AlkP superfamily phosphohydrolase/phosphomutase